MKLRAMLAVLGITFAMPFVGQEAVHSGNDSSGPTKAVPNRGGAVQVSDFADRSPRYQLRCGDAFELSFQFSPEFNQSVSVQPDGFITLRGAGEMKVQGLTIPELKKRLEDAYGAFLNKPEIFVVLRDFDRPYFVAAGMVGRPGKYELRGDVTLIEAIAMAGGLNDASKHSQVVLFRKVSSDQFEAKVLNVKKMLASKDLSEDLHLQPGDIVYVPQNRVSKFRRFIPSTGMGMSVTPPL